MHQNEEIRFDPRYILNYKSHSSFGNCPTNLTEKEKKGKKHGRKGRREERREARMKCKNITVF